MRALKILLVFSMLVVVLPVHAADKAAPEDTEAKKKQDQPKRAERPPREAVKLSPQARESAPRPDASDQMKRVAPPRAESPLQHVPALMDPPPGVKAPANP